MGCSSFRRLRSCKRCVYFIVFCLSGDGGVVGLSEDRALTSAPMFADMCRYLRIGVYVEKQWDVGRRQIGRQITYNPPKRFGVE